ncbi:MAG: trimethylamine methyltransferase family protein [Candidatus Riflebacteria bacterium]|nr:trimethylamine methyltransferase family protein [Candidatus Riflebacteria bacterium]
MTATRPRAWMFTPDEVEAIVGDALKTLEKTGVFVENDEARALLDGAGMQPREGRIRVPEARVREALGTVPPSIRLYDRDGALACDLAGDNVHFDPGSAALFFLDPKTRRRRDPTTDDLVRLAWVVESCKNYAAQSTSLVPGDIPGPMRDRFRLYVALIHSRKPVVTGTFDKDAFAVMRSMLEAIRGGAEALAEKPLAIFDCCPTPPLKWSDLTTQALIDSARAGIPAEMVSMPLAGATSPVTLREMVVQHCAECLSGVVIHQLARPGAPIVWGGSPSAFDMRHGTTPMGAIETMMVDMGYAQVGKRLGLPTHAYMGLSDAKTVDWQAGMESGIGSVLAALAGVNMVSGPGMLDFESCQSLENIVLGNEICGMALRLARGIVQRGTVPAPDLLAEVVAREQFLGHRHTRENYRAELYLPGPVVDRATYGGWEKAGARSSFDVAVEQVAAIVARGCPAPLDQRRRGALDELMDRETRRLGLSPLPPV